MTERDSSELLESTPGRPCTSTDTGTPIVKEDRVDPHMGPPSALAKMHGDVPDRLASKSAAIASTAPGGGDPQDLTHTSEPTGGTTNAAPNESLVPRQRDPMRYRVLGEHGRGGIGRVSRAHDLELGRDIAIKELISRGPIDEVRFFREALITARLEHPGIVPVHEAGRWPDGTPFYAMKLVSGRPLRDLLAERKTVQQRIALLHHVIAVADAIAYAHGRNIIHRDLKPSNVIIGDFGETVVIDWGLAKDLSLEDEVSNGASISHGGSADLTSTGAVMGTPAYMPPEQARGEPVDQRADVFAIGAMLWELCTLEKLPPAFSGQRSNLLRKSGIDPDLEVIVTKAVEPDRDSRYPDAAALAGDLRAFKAGARIAARRYSPWAMLTHWVRRHRSLVLLSSVAFTILVFGGASYVRNIARERDRANEMRERAGDALLVAHRDRDRALLAEAVLWLDKDPTTAKSKLVTLPDSPQRSLLLSRADHLSASHDIRLSDTASSLFVDAPSTTALAVVGNKLLVSLDLETGATRTISQDLRGAAAPYKQGAIYARRAPNASEVEIASTLSPTPIADIGTLLADVTSQLIAANGHIYILENEILYVIEDGHAVQFAKGIQTAVGSEHLLITCTSSGDLSVLHDDVVARSGHCVATPKKNSVAVSGDGYAYFSDHDTLQIVVDDQIRSLHMRVTNEYALALAPSGLLAMYDSNGGAAYVRPSETTVTPGPPREQRPMSVAAVAAYVAWGYANGSVVVLDTKIREMWEFQNQEAEVTSVAIDELHHRVISVAGTDLRIWPLKHAALEKIADVPCVVFNISISPDKSRATLDCYDGSVRVWSFADNSVIVAHRHKNLAFGLAWLRDTACSSGFDGHVMCTHSTGEVADIVAAKDSIRWIAASPNHDKLAIATNEGRIQEYDGSLRTLYVHATRPYRMAYRKDGRLLASGDFDGWLIVYDEIAMRVIGTTQAHAGRVTSVAWHDDDLWTTGTDGLAKRWRVRQTVSSNPRAAIELQASQREAGSFKFFKLLTDGWCANIDGHSTDTRFLVVSRRDPAQSFKLSLNGQGHVEHFEISEDERYIVLTLSAEAIIVDLALHRIGSLRIASDGRSVVAFGSPGVLAITTGESLLTIPLSVLDYRTFY